jgi:hypothetical protein
MTAALKNEISARQAQKLWGLLRQHFVNFERTLEEIIEKRAWEPMGYGSFIEAWTAQMGDVTLAAEFRPHVVYAYFDQGATIDEVVDGVKGVGHRRAQSLKRQKDNGTLPSAATLGASRQRPRDKDENITVVSQHLRKKPSEAGTIHVSVGPLKLKRINRVAKKLGMSAEEFTMSAINEKLDATE